MAIDSHVLVVHHKDNAFLEPSKRFFNPIQVGRALSETNLGIDHDYYGDNISHKNPTYCELTALYHAMNYVTSDYVGLMHYRRIFIASYDVVLKVKQQSKDYDQALMLIAEHSRNAINDVLASGVDIIVATPAEAIDAISNEVMTIEQQYRINHNTDDWSIYEKVIKHFFPELKDAFDEVAKSDKIHCCNMFVMSRRFFLEYSEILFAVMGVLEQRICLKNKTKFQKRVFGFLAERFLHLYVTYRRKNGAKVQEMEVIYLEGV
jgi:hypothetical protein